MRLFRVVIGILLVHIIYSFSDDFGVAEALNKQLVLSFWNVKAFFGAKTILRLGGRILFVCLPSLFRTFAAISGFY